MGLFSSHSKIEYLVIEGKRHTLLQDTMSCDLVIEYLINLCVTNIEEMKIKYFVLLK